MRDSLLPPRCRPVLVLAAVLALFLPAPTYAQDRLFRTTPGLVLDTGACHAMCDMLFFTADGVTLLESGDDKVVRSWNVGDKRFLNHRSDTLRWPIYREQRGGIFAMALSPGDASRVVVGGFGVKTGFLAVLNRSTGAIEHAVNVPPTDEVTWSVAYSPGGRYVVYGTERGKLFRWDLAASAKKPVLFKGSGDSRSKKVNRVRLVAFVDRTRFVSVAQDGKIREWDVTNPGGKPRELGQLELPGIYRAALGGKGRWLAATGEGAKEGLTGKTELIDLQELRTRGTTAHRFILPGKAGVREFSRIVAFDSTGERLAIGTRLVLGGPTEFQQIVGGRVHVFAVPTRERLTGRGLDLGYTAEGIAFRPRHKNQIATAGGNNHEVRLWDLTNEKKPLDEIRSPGACLWGVAMSRNDRYLAWKEERAAAPSSPNTRGGGPWHILDLEKHKSVKDTPDDFKPIKPLASADGWSVESSEADGYVWNVVAPNGTRIPLDDKSGLYFRAVNLLPRCYTFIEAGGGKPVRLAVGHMWGVSLYELRRPNKVKWVRVMLGHEAEVMAVAPSANGKLLVTASRDQTLAGWSLADWPSKSEMGARFRKGRKGELEVEHVDGGSPAWEAGLIEGDEVFVAVVMDRDSPRGFVYNPGGLDLKEKYGIQLLEERPCTLAQILVKLRNPDPLRERIFVWKHDGKERARKTRVIQRPLWRFFPTHSSQGSDWVIWRWRDFYYDTSSAAADRLVGWHVNPEKLDRQPIFHPLEDFRGTDLVRNAKNQVLGFHKPGKIWPFVRGAPQNPDKVIFPDIEPPQVKVTVKTKPSKTEDLVLSVTVKPYNATAQQQLDWVMLWRDDYRYPKAVLPIKNGAVSVEVTIKRGDLHNGFNNFKVVAYNDQGGRGQDVVPVEYAGAAKADLYGLCVGINNYNRLKGFGMENLRWSCNDAAEMKEVLDQHNESGLYGKADIKLVEEENATAAEIAKQLQELGSKVRPNDWFVLFLSGHGNADKDEPGSFYYLCADSDAKKPASVLTSRQLYDILTKIRGRKLIILDTCRSGDVASNPLRDFNRDGVTLLIFSSCNNTQSALEPNPKFLKGKHGLFTQVLLQALKTPEEAKGKKRLQVVTAQELAGSVRTGMRDLLRSLKADEDQQTPVFYPDTQPLVNVLCKP